MCDTTYMVERFIDILDNSDCNISDEDIKTKSTYYLIHPNTYLNYPAYPDDYVKLGHKVVLENGKVCGKIIMIPFSDLKKMVESVDPTHEPKRE